MIGRLACRDPYAIAKIHHRLYPVVAMPSRTTVLENYIAYAKSEHAQYETIHRLCKPILNLVHGLPGARAWKAALLNIQSIHNKQDWDALVQRLAQMEKGNPCT